MLDNHHCHRCGSYLISRQYFDVSSECAGFLRISVVLIHDRDVVLGDAKGTCHKLIHVFLFFVTASPRRRTTKRQAFIKHFRYKHPENFDIFISSLLLSAFNLVWPHMTSVTLAAKLCRKISF